MAFIKGADGRLYSVDKKSQVKKKSRKPAEARGFVNLSEDATDIKSSASIIMP